MSFLNEILPETAEAYGQMRNSIFKDGYLDLKTKELIAIVSSVLMRCQFCVCELIFKLNERQNLVSHHLAIMKNCGIVEAYSSSKWHFYKLNPEFRTIFNTISQIKNKKSE